MFRPNSFDSNTRWVTPLGRQIVETEERHKALAREALRDVLMGLPLEALESFESESLAQEILEERIRSLDAADFVLYFARVEALSREAEALAPDCEAQLAEAQYSRSETEALSARYESSVIGLHRARLRRRLALLTLIALERGLGEPS